MYIQDKTSLYRDGKIENQTDLEIESFKEWKHLRLGSGEEKRETQGVVWRAQVQGNHVVYLCKSIVSQLKKQAICHVSLILLHSA